MRGKVSRQLRRVVFEAFVEMYRKAGAKKIPVSTYQISPNGRYIICTGYRAAYKQAKTQWREAMKPPTPGSPEEDRTAVRARRQKARARKRELWRQRAAEIRAAREEQPCV